MLCAPQEAVGYSEACCSAKHLQICEVTHHAMLERNVMYETTPIIPHIFQSHSCEKDMMQGWPILDGFSGRPRQTHVLPKPMC